MITKQTKELIQTIPNNLISKKIKRAMVITLTEAYKQELRFLEGDNFREPMVHKINRIEMLKDSINTMEEIKWML